MDVPQVLPGALVNRNIPDHALVVGNPAKQIGWACKCGEHLSDDQICLSCEREYEKADGNVREIVQQTTKPISQYPMTNFA